MFEPVHSPARPVVASPDPLALPDLTDPVVTVVPWADPLLDRFGHDPRSPYVERFWLPIVGPSGTVLLRRLAGGFDANPDGYRLDLAVAARALGMGRPDGLVTASFRRTLDRVISFGFARLSCGRIDAIGENDSLSVRRRLPGLTSRQLERLPRALRDDHDSWCASQPTDEVIRSKVQRLAHSLLQLGEPPQAVEQHLLRLDFHPNVVHTGVRHALDRLARAEPACSDDAA